MLAGVGCSGHVSRGGSARVSNNFVPPQEPPGPSLEGSAFPKRHPGLLSVAAAARACDPPCAWCRDTVCRFCKPYDSALIAAHARAFEYGRDVRGRTRGGE